MKHRFFAVAAVTGSLLVATLAGRAADAPRHTRTGTAASVTAPLPAVPAIRPQAPPQQSASPASQPAEALAADQAIVKQYCVTCHNDRALSGGLSLAGLDVMQVAGHAETWEKVVRKLRTGMMPPAGAPRPELPRLEAFTSALEERLDRAHVAGSDLHTPALHRLNRTEYAYAIRDLLDIEVDVIRLLPGDGSSEGFDNIAEALSVSPTLIQGYVAAAMKISRLAVGDRTAVSTQTTYTAPPGRSHAHHIDGLPLGTRGGLLVRHFFPLDAEYEISTGGGRGGGSFANMDLTIDGERPTSIGGRGMRVRVPAGPRVVGVALLDRQRSSGADDIYSDFRTDAASTPTGGVQSVVITGPFNPSGVGDTPSRRRIFSCRPDAASEETACAASILKRLARHAYRGPVSDAELATLMTFYEEGRRGGDFENGIQHALARILVAPRFLFRIEEAPANARNTYRISDLELASRLSFFLWSSIPDPDLLDLADAGRLGQPAALQAQVNRMLADPRADALVTNFAGQWLYLRELAGVQTEAAGFDDNLRESFKRETEMLFAGIVRENRSVVELLDADYTFVDERLARHYGIPDIRGSYFRRVSLPADSPRRGLLGHGSMLTVTSVATRTSPVMRGKWILENLFGAPPPEPPPGVETNLEETVTTEQPRTLRQRLEMHRANPVCASCHSIMDPLGFALENYDLVGAWREKDGAHPIDASGRLADGTPVNGPNDLREALLRRHAAFAQTVTEKLLMYALGRPLEYHDMPLVRAITREAAKQDYRFSAFVHGIVESRAFGQRAAR
jgi:mono/diheme cytochrome c family protein